jgi:acetyl-CoA carboxylase biotin carboxylase subunit
VERQLQREIQDRMQRALNMFIVEGIYTSIPMHQRILADQDFQAGKFDTNFIKRFMPVKAGQA